MYGKESYLVSVIRKISLANRPMKFTDSSTRANLGMGIVVDWYTDCQSWTLDSQEKE